MYRPFPLGKKRCLQRSSDLHPLPPRLEALLDQARGVFIADGDGRRSLDALLRVEKVESRIAPLDPEHSNSVLPLHDVDADSIGQIEHHIVSVRIVQQAARVAFRPKGTIRDAVTEKNDSARRIVLP